VWIRTLVPTGDKRHLPWPVAAATLNITQPSAHTLRTPPTSIAQPSAHTLRRLPTNIAQPSAHTLGSRADLLQSGKNWIACRNACTTAFRTAWPIFDSLLCVSSFLGTMFAIEPPRLLRPPVCPNTVRSTIAPYRSGLNLTLAAATYLLTSRGMVASACGARGAVPSAREVVPSAR
jgi:hypothetical protein